MSTTAIKKDFRVYYDLDEYLFETVSQRFVKDRSLDAFDFFCIIIWKANRSKTKVLKRLLAHANSADLDLAVRTLVAAIAAAPTPKEKLRVLVVDWGFLVPTASAILTVLYPNDFTVYDVRVCDILGDFHWVANRTNYESIWTAYTQYIVAVREKAPVEFTLRDKDRWLWGRSFYTELQEDIATKFSRTRKVPTGEEA
jgi:hypothetical protein